MFCKSTHLKFKTKSFSGEVYEETTTSGCVYYKFCARSFANTHIASAAAAAATSHGSIQPLPFQLCVALFIQ